MSDRDATHPGSSRHVALFIMGLVFMFLGVHPVSAMCFVVVAAHYWLIGNRPKAYGTAALAAIVATVLLGSGGVGLFYAASVMLGCLLGNLAERHWSYGWRLTAVAGLAFVGVGLFMAVMWPTLRHETTIFMNARLAELEAQSDVNQQWLEMFRWYDVNYPFIGIGTILGTILLMLAFVLSIVERWQVRLTGVSRRRTSGFQRMRLPDWLVWVAIAVALMWFAENRWPNDALRAVTWNSAVVLSFVYWLSGFSILLYSLTVLKATALASFMIVAGIFLFGLMHLLALFGLFDTWFDFRVRFRRLSLLRQIARRSDDQEY